MCSQTLENDPKKLPVSGRTSRAGGTHVIQGQANDTLQTLELAAVVWALGQWAAEPINVISDSQYVVGVVQRIDEALIRTPKNERLGQLFFQVRQAI